MTVIIRRHPLFCFVVLAHLLSWLVLPFYFNGTYPFPVFPLGISLAATIIVGVEYANGGLKRFLANLNFRSVWWCYAFALFAPPIFLLLVTLLSLFWRFEGEFLPNPFLEYLNFLWFYCISPFSAPLGEELGWCGYFFPRLLKNGQSFITACSLMGLAWIGWHIPVLVLGSGAILAPHVLILFLQAFIYGWLYRACGYNVLVAILFHASYNAISAVTGTRGGLTAFWWLNAGCHLVVVIILLVKEQNAKSRQ
jgi:membrane protease YdiL (CAAX protease family)